MRSLFYFIPFTLFFISCSLADIRPPVLSNAGFNADLKQKGLLVIDNPNIKELKPDEWKEYKQIQFIVKDVWHSNFVRFFTPISEKEQRMRVYIDFEKDAMEVELLGGEKRGLIYGLSKKEPYQIASDTGKVFTGDDEVRIYLESLRLYLTLPWRLKEFSILMHAGSAQKGSTSYEMVYLTSVQPEATPDTDQYLAYFESESGALEWIEFTYRELFSFYKGVLKYGFYEPWMGKQYPRRITILDRFEDQDFVHELRIERIEFPKKPMEEEDKVLEEE
ncbi:hypothetical protein P3G55_14785 [Leptospira sp. 96542]|nr:hypothetical protein [Leptospira sp. 96542]